MCFLSTYYDAILFTALFYYGTSFSILEILLAERDRGGERKGGEGENGFCGKIELELIEGEREGEKDFCPQRLTRGPPEEEGTKITDTSGSEGIDATAIPFTALQTLPGRKEGRKEGSSEDEFLTAERGKKFRMVEGGKGQFDFAPMK